MQHDVQCRKNKDENQFIGLSVRPVGQDQFTKWLMNLKLYEHVDISIPLLRAKNEETILFVSKTPVQII